ncbi:hypothetical protein ACFL0D_08195 [Thermoproteota archaeon]
MSYENIQEKIQAVRNIVGADHLVSENNLYKQKVIELQQIIKDNESEYQRSLSNIHLENARLRSELTKANQPSITYKKKKYSPTEFNIEVNKKFDEKVEQRIQLEAGRRYQANKDKLIQEEINRYPLSCSNETSLIIDGRVSKELVSILYNDEKWPSRFQEYVSLKVQERADTLKDQEYYIDLEKAAADKLEDLKNGAWSVYLEMFCRDTLTPFLRNDLRTQIISLQEVFHVACPKCGNTISFRLTPDTLAATVQGRSVKIQCTYCGGFWGSTTFPLNLGQVFWLLTYDIETTMSAPQIVKARVVKAKLLEEDNPKS